MALPNVIRLTGRAAWPSNVIIGLGKTYVKLREERDNTLNLQDRMLYVLQVNLRGGRLPEPEADGHRYFKIPANKF